MILFRRIGVSLLLLAGLAFMTLTFASMAEGQGKKDTGGKKEPGVKPAGRVNWNETKVAFDMSGKPWSTAITWFSNQVQMPLTGKYKAPYGTVVFQNVVGKDGKPREYTLAEIYDILNEMLMAENHIILRRDATLMIFPADGDIPDAFIQRIEVAELPEHAKTEIVEVTITLKGSLNAEEFAVKAKRLLGPFSSVTPIDDTNQLIVRGPVGSISRHLSTLTGKDPTGKIEEEPSSHTLAYKCKFLRATAAEALLRKAMGDLVQVIVTKGGSTPGAPPEKGGGENPGGGPGGMFGRGGGGPGGGGPGAGGGGNQSTKRRVTTITSDNATNQVIVTGPADKVELAKTVLAKVDVERVKGEKSILVGPPFFKIHEVPLGNADVMAKMLGDIFKDDSVRININPPSRLLVYADPQTHLEINLLLNSEPPAAQEMALVRLGQLDSSRFADSLKAIFPDSKNGSPFIEADTDANAIRLRGTAEQVKAVKLVIQAYDGGAAGGGGVRMVTLDKGSAATVGEALFQLFPRIRDNPVELNLPGGGFGDKDKKEDKKDDKIKEGPPKSESVPVPKKAQNAPIRITPDTVREAMYENAKYSPVMSYAQDKIAEVQPKKEPDKKKPAVTITAFGNRILLTSEDPDALDILQQMIRILVNTEAGPGDFEVIRVKYASAVEVAKILDEAFNGPKGGGGGKGGPGGGGGLNIPGIPGILSGALGIGGGGNNGRVENIRVVADPGTNVLLVRAKPIDLMTIRRLLANSLDRDRTEFDNDAQQKDFYIALKNVRAADMAEILERSYHDSVSAKSAAAQSAPAMPFMFPGQSSPAPSSGASVLSVTVDTKNGRNGVIVHCPTTLYTKIEALVKTIEKEAVDKKQIIRVVPVDNIDPYALASAVAAITGKPSAQQSGAFGSTMTPGSFNPGFGTGNRGQGGQFGAGGGNPFGGGGGGNPFGGGGGNPFGGGGNPFGGGGGGNPFGGGMTPAIGAPQGGGNPAGGFNPGGGGKGGGGKGGGKGLQSRGPDFFEQRVMDDPCVNRLYDPASEPDLPVIVRNENVPVIPVYTANPFYFASYLQPDEKLQPIIPEKVPAPKGAGDGALAPPLLDFNIVQVPGGLLFIGSPEDYEAVLRIFDALTKNASGAKVEIKLVPVQIGDPTHITSQVSVLLNRVHVEANSTSIPGTITAAQGAPQQGAQPAAGGATGGPPLPYGVVLLPQPRLSAIWVAAPAARMKEIIGYIQQLDAFPSNTSSAVTIHLKHAPASQVAAALNAFYLGGGATGGTGTATSPRYSPPDIAGYNQIRVLADVHSNSVIVQASPGDLREIRMLIDHLDNAGSQAKTELRIIPLKNAVAFDLAEMLKAAVGTGTLTAQSTLGLSPGSVTTNAGGQTTTQGANQIANTKTSTVAFWSPNSKDGKPVESDLMEDIRFNSEPRTNSIIVSAPAKTMPLILALIRDLDVQPNARMEINIFTLKKSDAAQMAYTLQGLFLGNGGVGGTQTTNAGANTGGTPVATGGTGTARPIQITVQGTTPDGPPIIDLRLSVDQRTNSLIVAGSRNDLLTVGSIIARIEDAKVADRCSQVVRLRNAQAVDIVNALTTYVTGVTTIYKTYNLGTNGLEPAREVVLVAEPITNSIIVDATPVEFDKILRIIAHLDTTPPQVVVSVLIAEVTLNGNEEFGCEIGLQSPIMFARNLIPGATNVTYTTTAGGPANGFGATGIAPTVGQYVTGSGYGLNFNSGAGNPGPIGIDNPGMIGYQGLTNLGVGRTSTTSGIGGFVFSAQGSLVNVLLRALKTQQRLTVLSRPNVQCLDKQAAVVVVGQQIPLNSGSNATATGTVTVAITRQSVGVTLQVTPSITPDGRVLMRVIPEVTGIANTAFPLGNGQTSTSLSIQHLETTVNAEDGETVLLGGLISKQSDKNQNGVPWFSDLPGIGSLFRYRTESTTQTELIIIMTPHVVRNRQEGERVLAEEARRIHWEFGDVMRVHGSGDCAPFMPAPQTPGQTQPYRIIPGQTPNGTPGALPQMNCLPGQNCYPGQQAPGVYQGGQPQMQMPGAQSSTSAQPVARGPAIVNAAEPAPQAPASRIVPSVQSAAPPPATLGGATRIPAVPAPTSPPPIMLPQELQSPGPPNNVPWVMPAQTNYYDKK